DDYLKELDKQPANKRSNVESIYESLVAAKPLTFEECIIWARFKFEELFNNNIKQLLYNFPLDMKTSSGTPFWGGPKRPPMPLEFDSNNQYDMDFVIAAANLRAQIYGLKGYGASEYDFRKILSSISVPEFQPQAGVKISADDKEEAEMQQSSSSSGM